MTKKELEKIINTALKENYTYFNWEELQWEDLRTLLGHIEGQNDTLMYELTTDREGHPNAIQVFTYVNFKGNNYDIILDFEMQRPTDQNNLLEILWDLYKRALETQKNFKS